VIVEPGLIASQKNRLGSEGGSVSLEKLKFLLDIYPGALAIMCTHQKLKVIAPSEARGVGIGRNLMKFAIVTQWVRVECGSSPT
jgi:hypothetical protein